MCVVLHGAAFGLTWPVSAPVSMGATLHAKHGATRSKVLEAHEHFLCFRQAETQGRAGCRVDHHALDVELEAQKTRGSVFFIGEQLSALDVYWAAFAALLHPLPDELCPMNEMMRQNYTVTEPALLDAASPLLLEHRQRIYQTHMQLPIQL